MKLWLPVFCVAAFFLATGEAQTIKCYACTCPPWTACGEPFDEHGLGVSVINCARNYTCTKIVSQLTNGQAVIRSCTPGRFNTSEPTTPGRSIFTCDTDLCNGATSFRAPVLLASTILTISTILVNWN